MSSQHLSELCRKSNVESIVAFLKQKKHSDDTVTFCDEVADGDDAVDCDAPPYMSGIWSYQDDDGRTAFHWAVALENYDLARTLMLDPYNAPVLTEDSSRSTPFMTACALGADYSFIVELLEKSAAVYEAYLMWRGNLDTADGAMHAVNRANMAKHEMTSTSITEKTTRNKTTSSSTAAPLQPDPPLCNSSRDDAQGSAFEEAGVGSKKSTDEMTPSVQAMKNIVNWQDTLGNTALFVALRRGSINVVRLLLQYCDSISHQNKHGQSVLHRVVMTAKMNLVEEVVYFSEKSAIDRKSHVRWMNLQDKNGDTALFYASSDENEEIGVFLIRHGSYRHLRNKQGKLFWEM